MPAILRTSSTVGLRVIARPPRIIEKTRLIEVVKQIMTRAARCAITTSAKTIDITILNLIYRGVVRQGEGCLGLDYGRATDKNIGVDGKTCGYD